MLLARSLPLPFRLRHNLIPPAPSPYFAFLYSSASPWIPPRSLRIKILLSLMLRLCFSVLPSDIPEKKNNSLCGWRTLGSGTFRCEHRQSYRQAACSIKARSFGLLVVASLSPCPSTARLFPYRFHISLLPLKYSQIALLFSFFSARLGGFLLYIAFYLFRIQLGAVRSDRTPVLFFGPPPSTPSALPLSVSTSRPN
jgi:hypothetical protein